MRDLRRYLLAAEERNDRSAAIERDPVRFVRRYASPGDREVAGLLASAYATGRVSLFGPVLERIFAALDAGGGPLAFVRDFDPDRDRSALARTGYRFYTPTDLVLLLGALRDVIGCFGTLEHVFRTAESPDGRGERCAAGLHAIVSALRDAAAARVDPRDPPRGLRHLLPTPRDGSACKRLNLWLRWMVRPDDGVDLGVWSTLSAADLIIPLDVHVLRVSRFLGLTQRSEASWRTAVEVTASLATLDAADPVRFDFALAHLGISGACRGARHPEACPLCPLDPVCRA